MTALDALNLAAPLADTYNSVEQRLLVSIARQLSLNDDHSLNEVSKWQIKRLSNLGMLRNDAAKIIAAGTKGVPADFADTVRQAIESTLAEDGLTDMWKNAGFSESAKQSVKHYRAQARDVYNQVNTVMKYKAESSFVNAVNSVADKWTAEMRRQQAEIADKQGVLDILNSNTADVVNGSAARTRAVRTAIHEMAQKGIPAFVDKAGREWSPEAYVNMDIRATVKNTALEAQFSVMDSLGQDVFEVSSHPGSRPKCRPWQGKLISRSGKTTEITDINGRKHEVIPLSRTSFGEPDGLFGINCGHRPRGVSDGLFRKSEVAYDDEEDKELYGKVCHQRELERQVRKSKTEADMLEAAGDTEGAKKVRRRMAEQNKALRAYCEENGLKFRSDRVKTYGAVAPKKTLDKSAKSGILKLASKFVNPNEQLYLNANRIKPIPGYGDIVIHGSPTSLIINGLDGEEWTYDAKEAAEMIRNSREFHGQPIRLISCQTGALEDGIAQQIADILGVEILAPTEIVNVDINGEMFICDNDIIAKEWNESSSEKRKKIHEPGTWKPFTPRKE